MLCCWEIYCIRKKNEDKFPSDTGRKTIFVYFIWNGIYILIRNLLMRHFLSSDVAMYYFRSEKGNIDLIFFSSDMETQINDFRNWHL